MKLLIYLLVLFFSPRYATAQQDTSGPARTVTDTIPKNTAIFIATSNLQPDSLVMADSLEIWDVVKTTGRVLMGTASFYSRKFEGRKTATGDTFRHNKFTAASNNFKLNSWVRVTNIRNNKSVIVRINDRMHPRMKKKGRVVDLTRMAAAKLGFLKGGLTKVKVEVVQKGVSK